MILVPAVRVKNISSAMANSPKLIHVAVGVIKNSRNQVLLAKRPDHVHQGGLWEFSGGKVEPDETVESALYRELNEELDIEIQKTSPLIKIRHNYSDKSVLLDVLEVTEFSGTPQGKEGQPLKWVDLSELSTDPQSSFPLPAANRSIVYALHFPSTMLIIGESQNVGDFTEKLTRSLQATRRMVYLRSLPKTLSEEKTENLIKSALTICQSHNSPLLLSSHILESQFDLFEIFLQRSELGMQLSSKDLKNKNLIDKLPQHCLLGASCHNKEELMLANQLGASLVTLSPINVTTSHPQATPMGWEKFNYLAEYAAQPVYALGGMSERDIEQAKSNGAQGVAGISGFWQ